VDVADVTDAHTVDEFRDGGQDLYPKLLRLGGVDQAPHECGVGARNRDEQCVRAGFARDSSDRGPRAPHADPAQPKPSLRRIVVEEGDRPVSPRRIEHHGPDDLPAAVARAEDEYRLARGALPSLAVESGPPQVAQAG